MNVFAIIHATHRLHENIQRDFTRERTDGKRGLLFVPPIERANPFSVYEDSRDVVCLFDFQRSAGSRLQTGAIEYAAGDLVEHFHGQRSLDPMTGPEIGEESGALVQ